MKCTKCRDTEARWKEGKDGGLFFNLLWRTGEADKTWGNPVDTNVHNATASVFQNCELLMFQNYKMNTLYLSVLVGYWCYFFFYCSIIVKNLILSIHVFLLTLFNIEY